MDLTLCLLDIDDFTIYNLKLGFEIGNALLNEILELIHKIPNQCGFRRVDSDEFLFCCFGTFNENKQNLVRLMQAVETNLKVTVSIGATEINGDIELDEILLNILKRYVLIVKNNGKNKIYIS